MTPLESRVMAAVADALQSAIDVIIVCCAPVGNPDVDDAEEIRQVQIQLRAALAQVAALQREGEPQKESL